MRWDRARLRQQQSVRKRSVLKPVGDERNNKEVSQYLGHFVPTGSGWMFVRNTHANRDFMHKQIPPSVARFQLVQESD